MNESRWDENESSLLWINKAKAKDKMYMSVGVTRLTIEKFVSAMGEYVTERW
jgi:hypothetical protein